MKNFEQGKMYLTLCLWVMILPYLAKSQTPNFSRSTQDISSGIFLNTTALKTQLLYAPGDITGATPIGDGFIDKIYFSSTTAGQGGVYNQFYVRLGQTPNTTFTGTNNLDFYTALDTLFYRSSFTLNGSPVANGWFEIPLDKPYFYDHTQTLIVEVQMASLPTSGIATWSSGAGTGSPAAPNHKKMYSATLNAATGTSHSGYWQDFGVHLTINTYNDAAISEIQLPQVICNANEDLKVKLANRGNNTLNSVNVNWELDGAAQPGINWTFPLDSNNSTGTAPKDTVLTLGSINFPTQTLRTIRVWTSMPNGTVDTSTYNDTLTVTVGKALSGAYTIGGAGSNFANINAAVTALKNYGVCGPVTFNLNIASSPFTEQITIPQIKGTSATSGITFNGNGSTVRFTGVTGARHVIKLDGADYITLNNLKIVTQDPAFGWGVHLTNQADYNSITNCFIDLTATTATTAAAACGIVSSSSSTAVVTAGDNANYLTIMNDTINAGATGMSLNGLSDISPNIKTTIKNNVIRNFYLMGIDILNLDSTLIEGNDIHRMARAAVGVFTGINFRAGNTRALVTKNKIHGTHTIATTLTGAANGISVTSCDAAIGFENTFTNNLIYDFNGSTGTYYGLENSGSDGTRFYHNTVVLDKGTGATGIARAFTQATHADRIEVKNNILYITRGGTSAKNCLYFGTATSTIVSDNNILYMNAAGATNGVGYYGANVATIQSWRKVNEGLYDGKSRTTNPNFTSLVTPNYKPTNIAINNSGAGISGTTDDILGITRTSNPDPGAYEFTPAAGVDAELIWNSPVNAMTSGANTVTVTVKNTLTTTITSIALGYTNGTTPVTETFGPISIAPGASQQLSFTTPYNLSSSANLRAYITSVNGSADAARDNDTTETSSICVGLAGGNYTINSAVATGSGNYQTFAAAITAMSSCGILGPVVFDVAPGSGPYVEQITIPQISGASATNTITINGNATTISFAGALTGSRHVIKLDGADYVKIKDLNVVNSTAAFAWGIHLTNIANFDSIINCKIDVSASTTTTDGNSAAIVGSISSTGITTDGNFGNNLVIDQCVTNGGYYGILILGNTAYTPTQKIIITNDTIKNFYATGISLFRTDSSVIYNNDIHRINKSTTTTMTAISVGEFCTNTTISYNKIHDTHNAIPTSTSTVYGIYFTACDAPVNKPNVVFNNVLYNFNNTGAGTIYGLYNSSSNGVHYYHNTIVFDNTAATGASAVYGFYQTTLATDIEFKNNSVYINRGGTGTKYCIYMATSTSTIISNYNNLYNSSTGGATNGIGYFGSGFMNLTDWKTANINAFDQSSKSLNPAFANPSTNDYTPTAVPLNDIAPRLSIVPKDINGLSRGLNTDPGAYEYIIGACSTPIAGTAVTNILFPPCAGGKVLLDLSGSSVNTGLTYQWESSPTSGGPYTPVGALQAASPIEVTVNAKTYFRSKVNCTVTSTNSNSTEIEINISSPLTAGTYSINPALPAGSGNFQSIAAAVHALNCGVQGSIVFNIANGTYNERADIAITLPSLSDSIVFKSASGDTSAVHITWPSANGITNNSIFNISRSRNIVFRNLSFERTGVEAYSSLFELDSTVGVKFYDNQFIGPYFTATNTTGTQSHIFSNDTKREDSTIVIGNNFIGNSNAMWFFGNLTKTAEGTIIRNNKMTNSYLGIFLKHHNGAIIKNNTIRRNGAQAADYYGISLENCDSATDVSSNQIFANRGYGIKLLGSSGTTTFRNKIINNMIGLDQGTGTAIARGIMLESSAAYKAENIDIYHNTIYVKSGSATTGNVIWLEGTATALTGKVNIKNNILTNAGIGYVYNSAASTIDSATCKFDRNNVYAAGVNIGTWKGVIIPKNQSSWITTTGMDSLSSYVPVYTVDSMNLHLTGSSISNFNLATDLVTLSNTDIDGTVRTGSFFYKGAHEATQLFPSTTADASIFRIDSLSSFLTLPGSNKLSVVLRNAGFVPLTSVNIGIKVNAAPEPTFSWAGNLAPGQSQLINLPNITLPTGFNNVITVWTENTNNTSSDINLLNDTNRVSTMTSDSLAGPYTVGPGLNFENLTNLSLALQRIPCKADAVFELASSYVSTTETFPITFSTLPQNRPYKLTIQPANGVGSVITQGTPASANHLIVLDSATNFTFDGRPGGTGTAMVWTIRNRQTTTTYGACFRFVNGSQNDTLRYLTMESQSTTTTAGHVVFSTTTRPFGNSYNTIENCTLRERTDVATTGGYIQIYSSGTDANMNHHNTIRNNTMQNFTSSAISLSATGNGGYWDISNNQFYCTTAATAAQTVIEILSADGSEGGYTISGNFIGGTAPNCGGGAWVNSGTGLFAGISLSTDSMAYSTISNNVIANIRKTNTGSSYFAGITVSRARVRITNNIIGRYGASDSVSCAGSSYMYGIQAQNNAGTADTLVMSNNTISYLVSTGTAVACRVRGIALDYTANIKPLNKINNNTIHHLSTTGIATGYNPDLLTVMGIYHFNGGYNTTAGSEMINNTVYAIDARNTGQYSTFAAGIVLANHRGIVANNRVYGITNKSTVATGTTTAVVAGIYNFFVSNFQEYNNMVSITGAGNSDSVQLNGIMIAGSTGVGGTNNLYHNSVVVENTTGQTVSSYALHRGQNDLNIASKQPISFKNNMFVNNISSPGKHYAIGIEDTSTFVLGSVNYNLYKSTNPAMLAQYGSQVYDLAGWSTRTTYDANSKNTDVFFTDVNTADLHITTNSIGNHNLAGIYLTAVQKDFDGETRHTYPYMGADENTTVPLPVSLVQFTATESNRNVVLNWATAMENNSSHFEIERSVNGKSFDKLTKVKASDKSSMLTNYRYDDLSAFKITRSNTLYYRLKMVDNDGSFEYSPIAIVSVQDQKEKAPLTVFPNPYTDRTYINISAEHATDAMVTVVDITGKTVISYTEAVAQGNSVLELNEAHTLNSGIYFVTIVMNGVSQQAKLIKH